MYTPAQLKYKLSVTPSVGDNGKEPKLTHTACGNVIWYNYLGKLSDSINSRKYA